MDINKIKILLDRYLDGISSLEDEQLLREFFTQNSQQIPDEWKHYIFYFKNIEETKLVEPAGNIEELVLAKLENKPSNIKKMKWVDDLWIVAAAAIVGGLLFTMNVVEEMTQPANQNLATVDYKEEEIEKAYKEAVHIMQFVSEKLNKGRKPLQEIKRIENINNKIKQRKYEML